jgi:hypothetical protein
MGAIDRSTKMSKNKDLTRREFVGAVAAASVPLFVPRRVLGRGQRAPSDITNVAIVGFGGM